MSTMPPQPHAPERRADAASMWRARCRGSAADAGVGPGCPGGVLKSVVSLGRGSRGGAPRCRPVAASAGGLRCGFLPGPAEIRRIVCTTNAIESVNARIRRAVRARGHFPSENAALKCVYLAVMSLDPTGAGRKRWTTPVLGPVGPVELLVAVLAPRVWIPGPRDSIGMLGRRASVRGSCRSLRSSVGLAAGRGQL